jgi:uncharacterized protein YndB with AHSA1/START domain
MNSTATAAIEVACDPKTAFSVFTDDIGRWWKPGTYYWNDPERGAEMRFDGRRLVEVYDPATGEGFEIGTVTVWDPPERLVFGWRIADWPPGVSTEVDVRFAATDTGTRVTIEHRGWDQFPDGPAKATGYGRGWDELLAMFAERTA